MSYVALFITMYLLLSIYIDIIIYRASDQEEYMQLMEVGATRALADDREAALRLGGDLLRGVLEIEEERISVLRKDIRDMLESDDSMKVEDLKLRKMGLGGTANFLNRKPVPDMPEDDVVGAGRFERFYDDDTGSTYSSSSSSSSQSNSTGSKKSQGGASFNLKRIRPLLENVASEIVDFGPRDFENDETVTEQAENWGKTPQDNRISGILPRFGFKNKSKNTNNRGGGSKSGKESDSNTEENTITSQQRNQMSNNKMFGDVIITADKPGSTAIMDSESMNTSNKNTNMNGNTNTNTNNPLENIKQQNNSNDNVGTIMDLITVSDQNERLIDELGVTVCILPSKKKSPVVSDILDSKNINSNNIDNTDYNNNKNSSNNSNDTSNNSDSIPTSDTAAQ